MQWQRLTTWAVMGGLLIGLLAVGAVNHPCAAATISYGNFGPVGPGISFLDVAESSGTDPVPLFGPPTPFVTGLDFDPANFVASAGAGAVDITDGQLNYTVMSTAGGQISSIKLSERGDYSLTGVGTNATQALAGAIIQATITQINGAAVAPFSLTPVNASVAFNLAANPGIVQPWSLGLTLNVAAQVAAQFGANARATKVEVAIDNQLQALSQTSAQGSSLAFIAKKDFRIDIGGDGVIPEPGTLLLLMSGCMGLVAVRGRSGR
jgi:hypothetical protein